MVFAQTLLPEGSRRRPTGGVPKSVPATLARAPPTWQGLPPDARSKKGLVVDETEMAKVERYLRRTFAKPTRSVWWDGRK